MSVYRFRLDLAYNVHVIKKSKNDDVKASRYIIKNDQVSYYYVIYSYSDQFSFAFRQMTNSFVFVWTEPIAKSPTVSCKKIWHKVVL